MPETDTLERTKGGAVASNAGLGFWRPIETAPLDETEIIICSKTDIGICYFSYAMKSWTVGWGKAFLNPTHWMPLPELPE